MKKFSLDINIIQSPLVRTGCLSVFSVFGVAFVLSALVLCDLQLDLETAKTASAFPERPSICF